MNHAPRFQISDGAASEMPERIDPAEMNQDIEWLQEVSRWMGLTCVCVDIPGKDFQEMLHQAGFQWERQVGDALKAEKLGEFDSIKRGDPIRIFFYLVTDSLPTALTSLQKRLEALAILKFCKIAHADLEAQ